MKGDWISNNIEKMMGQIMLDVRHGRVLPISITLHGIAYRKFIEILSSKAGYLPKKDGSFDFLGIPVYENNKLPYGTFTVERFSKQFSLGRN